MMWSGEIFFRSLERLNFRLVWPLSVDGDLRDCNNLPIAIYVIVLFLVGLRFKPRPNSMIFFIGPGFDSQARLSVLGQCDSWPMSLAPTNGELG